MWVKGVEVEIPFDVTLAAMVDRLKLPPSVLLKESAALMLRMWNLIGALDEAKAVTQ
jgi:hypothetical protein